MKSTLKIVKSPLKVVENGLAGLVLGITIPCLEDTSLMSAKFGPRFIRIFHGMTLFISQWVKSELWLLGRPRMPALPVLGKVPCLSQSVTTVSCKRQLPFCNVATNDACNNLSQRGEICYPKLILLKELLDKIPGFATSHGAPRVRSLAPLCIGTHQQSIPRSYGW